MPGSSKQLQAKKKKEEKAKKKVKNTYNVATHKGSN